MQQNSYTFSIFIATFSDFCPSSFSIPWYTSPNSPARGKSTWLRQQRLAGKPDKTGNVISYDENENKDSNNN